MLVLGIHDGHNAAAALVRDGRVVAAVQEERLTRIKNHDCFPLQAVARVLEMEGVAASEIDLVAFNGAHQPRHRSAAQLAEDVRRAGQGGALASLKQMARGTPANRLFRGLRRQERLGALAGAGFGTERATFVDHHQAHAAVAFWGAPRREGETLVLTCDGAGDDLCATVSVGREGRFERIAEIPEEHSIGMAYLTVTLLLGMTPNEHEYKVMGLAPYARDDERVEAAADVFRGWAEFEGGGLPAWRRREGTPHAFALYGWLRDRLEGKRFDHIAGGVQRWTEETLCEWVRRAVRASGVGRVALAGGVFMNVKANQAIAALPEVEELFIAPSCGDETNAVGAALAGWVQSGGEPAPASLGDIYWGEAFDDTAIEAALRAHGAGFNVYRPDDPASEVAALLARGQIVARFDGRSEFGARALGNRSLLADPMRPDAARRLNDAIKNRDFWMPFAPTVLAERASDYLVNPKGLPAPWMILAFDTTSRREEIRAATHPYDRTARPQVLEESANPRYHALLSAFQKRTGRGALLNTSFNLHGHPMVYSPADALDVLQRSGLRWLLMGDRLIEAP